MGPAWERNYSNSIIIHTMFSTQLYYWTSFIHRKKMSNTVIVFSIFTSCLQPLYVPIPPFHIAPIKGRIKRILFTSWNGNGKLVTKSEKDTRLDHSGVLANLSPTTLWKYKIHNWHLKICFMYLNITTVKLFLSICCIKIVTTKMHRVESVYSLICSDHMYIATSQSN